MNVVIIHRAARTDRIPAIAKIMRQHPEAIILDAKVPDWESTSHNVAVRGCTISHLSAVKAFLKPDMPLLVFEDDALPADTPADFSNIPADAGIVIYGGDVEQYGDADAHGYREVIPKYWGTQAVLYTPALLNSSFLLNAFEIAATSCLGRNQNGQGLCLESVLLLALYNSGLKMYRPDMMGYTVMPSPGDSGGDSGTRSKAMYATDRDSLLPWSTWLPVFGPWEGKKACLLQQPRNVGDELIRAGTLQLMRHFNIADVSYEEADVIFYPGGGCLGNIYPFRDYNNRFALPTDRPRVILPHTWSSIDPYDAHADVWWCREHRSIAIRGGGQFAPDLALAYRPSLKPELCHAVRQPVGKFFRQGEEQTRVPADNVGDPIAMCRTHYDYLRLAAQYEQLHTNRLHFAVAGLLMGSKVFLYPNSYHKNRSVWEASLRDLGCEFRDV